MPKGTVVVAMNQVKRCHVLHCDHFYSQVMCRQKRFFSDANSFLPERWLPEGSQPPPGFSLTSMTLNTWNFSRFVLGSPIRPRASRLYWSVTGFLFLFNSKSFNPNGFLIYGHMIFENSIIQIGRKLAEDSLVLLLIHLFARFRCCCELVSSSHLLQSTNPPCVVLTILNFISVHWD